MFIIDPFCGISGDMFISAFCDYIDKEELFLTIKKVVDVDLEIVKVNKRGILANKLIINYYDEWNYNYKEIYNLIKNSNIENNIKKTSLTMLKTLAEVESKIHNVDLEDVHFHELASYDTVVDLVGASYIINKLNLKDNSFYRPINLGNGFIDIEHGTYPVPPPAVAELLKNFKVFFSDKNFGELTTPTGAVIIKYINPKIISGDFEILKVSYGAGEKDLDIPNVLRVFKIKKENIEKVAILESNVDDTTGEILGNLFEVLDVKDLHFIPTYMKKNRPGYIIRAIVSREKAYETAKKIMKETGTIGVRVFYSDRFKADRYTKTIKVLDENVRIKVSCIDNEIINIKPEFEDLKKLSKKYNLTIREIYNIVKEKINEELL
ncbi:nickel pincer cofactor biosynthesis protein LarC [Methanocaldococcus indicus]|uniref:nickel pincer cofactor biosynthesis protein LarC n=1 Tax=Methanocaldococcus indicus TaxID=213231 RepID=UPI003C6D5F8D